MAENNNGKIAFSISGIVAVIAFTVMWFMAMDADPSWEYGVNTLSDMGVSLEPTAAALFNVGSMVAGALGIILALGMVNFNKEENRASGFMLIAACAFLFCIGIFTKDFGNGNMHNLVAILFFVCVIISMILAMVGYGRNSRMLSASFIGALLVVMVFMAVLTDLAALEVIAVGCVLVWILVESVNLAMSKA